ncbi:MAG TPA: DUF4136 domain-containing protein [Vicinamibacterales bacterium]|nr:DUF4136 domain-containing protein [Vicinamibacterales bacterium]
MLRPARGLIVPLIGVLTALGGPAVAQKLEVKSHVDPKADFSAIRTYAWLPPAPAVRAVAPDAVSNPTLTQEALGPHIVAAVDKELARRGLTAGDRESADVHMVYFAALTVGFNQSYLGEHYGYITGWPSPIPPGLAPSTAMTVHEKGTVLVDMVQRAAKRGIWRGSVVTRIDQEKTLQQRIARIGEAVERMFERFPIRPRK